MDNDITFWAFRPEWISLWGAVLGAIVGGAISAAVAWAVAIRVAKDQADVRRAERKETQRVLAFSFATKVSLIVSNYHSLYDTIDESIARAEANGQKGAPLFAKVIPQVGQLPKQSIDPAELAVFYEAGELDLVNTAVEIFIRHDSVLDAFDTYSRLRLELRDKMPMNVVEGSMVSSYLSKEQYTALAPRFLELDSLIRSIIDRKEESLKESAELSEKIGPAARRYFGDERFPLFKVKSKVEGR